MAVTLTADIELSSFRSVLSAYASAASDLTPLMDQCGALLEGSTADRLRDSNVSPDGAPWPKSMRAEFDGGKTLHDSGRLAQSIQSIAGRDQVEIGTNVIYGGIHQTGGDIVAKNGKALSFGLPGGEWATVGKVTIPARPYLGISQEDGSDLTALAVTYLDEAVAR